MSGVPIFICCFLSSLVALGNSQADIVSVKNIEDGSPFLITCNAQRVTLPNNVSSINFLKIEVMNNGAAGFTQVAQYLAFGPPDIIKQMENPPAGRTWMYNFTGSSDGNGINVASMKVQILVPDARCTDAGVYRCIVNYFTQNGGTGEEQSQQNVTSTAATTEPLAVLSPVYDAPPGMNNISTYDEGANFTVTCRFEGPQNLDIKWIRERRPAFGIDIQYEDYPYKNDITTTTPTRVTGTSDICPRYSHVSVLKLVASNDDTDRRYACVVLSDNQEKARSTVMVNVTSNPANQGSSQKDIVSVKNIQDGSSFLIMCDAQRVTLPSDVSTINFLQIEVWNNGAAGFRQVAMYLAFGPPGVDKQVENPPAGRTWVYNFTGSGDGNGKNVASMKVQILVTDARPTDAGVYRCTVNYFTQNAGTGEEQSQQSVTSTGSSQQDIVSVQNIQDGSSFLITCDAQRVTLPSRVASINFLQIEVWNNGAAGFTQVAQYLALGPPDIEKQMMSPPADRPWVYNFSGSGHYSGNNVASMKIKILIPNARCTDAGVYRCVVNYLTENGNTGEEQSQQNVTSTGC